MLNRAQIARESSVLLVVAHPDDEVLGAGGLAAWCAEQGIKARACILSGGVEARRHRPTDSELRADTIAAANLLGMNEPILGTFPNIAMNAVPHIELVRFIENAIVETQATHILTHHVNDLNDDHRTVSAACQAASRLWQRGVDSPILEGLFMMEIPSSTDWAFVSHGEGYSPNIFLPLQQRHLDLKLQALRKYRDVMRPMPHPRSVEVLTALATLRGAQCGSPLAESYQALFQRVAT